MIEIIKLRRKGELMNGLFVHLDKNDALQLIESLSHQIRTGDPNTERKEWLQIKGDTKLNYFTISVNDKALAKAEGDTK
jgi:hypothetical protein